MWCSGLISAYEVPRMKLAGVAVPQARGATRTAFGPLLVFECPLCMRLSVRRGNSHGLRRKAYASAYDSPRARRATDGHASRRIRSSVDLVEGNQWWQGGRRHPVGSGGGDFWGDEQRRLGVGARSAHPKLTRRACLSVANEVSAASSRRDAEPSSTVESARSADRPSMSPRQAPPGAACRAAPTYARIADAQPAAMGRKRSFPCAGSTDLSNGASVTVSSPP